MTNRKKQKKPAEEAFSCQITADMFATILDRCGKQGEGDVNWSENIDPPKFSGLLCVRGNFRDL